MMEETCNLHQLNKETYTSYTPPLICAVSQPHRGAGTATNSWFSCMMKGLESIAWSPSLQALVTLDWIDDSTM